MTTEKGKTELVDTIPTEARSVSEEAELVPATREEKIVSLKGVVDDLTITITENAQNQLTSLQDEFPESAIPEDLSDKKNFKMVHDAIQKIKAPRIELEKNRKEVVGPLNTAQKAINSAAKPLSDSYTALEDPWKKVKKDYETKVEIEKRETAKKEQERLDAISNKIAEVNALPGSNIRSDSAGLAVTIHKLENDMFAFQEFSEKGDAAKTSSLNLLNEMYEKELKNEQREAEEQKRLAKEAEEKAEAERLETERLAKQKEEQDVIAAKIKDQQDELDRQKEELEAEKQRVANAKVAEEKRVADAKAAEKARITAEEKRVADVKAAEKAAEEERIADAKAAEEKRFADEGKRIADAKAAEDKLIADEKERVDREWIMTKNKAREAKELKEKEAAAKEMQEANIKVAVESFIEFFNPSENAIANTKEDAEMIVRGIANREIKHLFFSNVLEPMIDG